jgi:hypothetical protein
MCVCVDAYLEWCVVLTLLNYRGTEIRQQNGPFIHAPGLKENVPRSGNVEEKAETLVVLKKAHQIYIVWHWVCVS